MLRVSFTAIRQGIKRRKYSLVVVRAALHAHSKQFLDRVVEDTRVYPPKPATSTYDRTYELDRSWKVVDKSQGVGIRYVIENRARDSRGISYATLVHGPNQQWG